MADTYFASVSMQIVGVSFPSDNKLAVWVSAFTNPAASGGALPFANTIVNIRGQEEPGERTDETKSVRVGCDDANYAALIHSESKKRMQRSKQRE